jgi:hypothetical protein
MIPRKPHNLEVLTKTIVDNMFSAMHMILTSSAKTNKKKRKSTLSPEVVDQGGNEDDGFGVLILEPDLAW